VHQESRCTDLVLVSISNIHLAIQLIIVYRQEYRLHFYVASSNMTDDTGKNLHWIRRPDVTIAQSMHVKGCHGFWDAEQRVSVDFCVPKAA
jgi:hypothetical protein